jgi:hypothetical protein
VTISATNKTNPAFRTPRSGVPGGVANDSAQKESSVPSDSFEFTSNVEAAKPEQSFGKKAANSLSFLAITGGIVVGAATGLLALPAVLIGIGVVSGAMALEKNEGSKLEEWMARREAKVPGHSNQL